MLIPGFIWLLVGLLATLIQADTGLRGWRVDSSCNDFKQQLQNSYIDLFTFAAKARDDIDRLVQGPEDDERWWQIQKTVWGMAGIYYDETNRIRALRARFDDVLKSRARVDPERGYRRAPNGGILWPTPLIVCNGGFWEVREPDQEDPNMPGSTLRKSIGATQNTLIKGTRYLRDMPPDTDVAAWLCGGGAAWTVRPYDMLNICFKNQPYGNFYETPQEWHVRIVKGHLAQARNAVSTILLHEMFHWSSIGDQGDTMDVDDHQCLDHRGLKVYRRPKTGELRCTPSSTAPEGFGRYDAYGFKCAINLARFDPDKGLHNADSLVMLALALYFDTRDWATGYPERWPENGVNRGIRPSDLESWRRVKNEEDNCPEFSTNGGNYGPRPKKGTS